ncbi:5-nucleotidase [Stylonychia lemnae]|uniref:5'-nucleotidase n=1 Tax=Stylonychia lemnae TaxID=5949 RepID=A0A078AJY4_STYLE|nr:5-nucleotidase [Stylonychia lemnae]|eukprot:CDW82484.1 5-nucleotidase [Stylonychia lemnae]
MSPLLAGYSLLFLQTTTATLARQLGPNSIRNFSANLKPAVNTQSRALIADYNSKELLIIKDSERVKNKLRHFHNHGGLENLCILSDFDYTLTRYSLDGYNKLDSSFSCISNSQFVSEEFRRINNVLYQRYHPFEKALNITVEEKVAKLQEWWEQDLEHITKQDLSVEHFYDMVETSNLHFRNGIDILLKNCSNLNVPLVIVSAAVADVVEKAVDKLSKSIKIEQLVKESQSRKSQAHHQHGSTHFGINPDVVHVIANKSKKCDEGKKILGFHDPLVHTCNKDQVVHNYFKNHQSQQEQQLLRRRNLIVMGDLIDDIKMAKHLHQSDEDLLTIGFFNNPAKDGHDMLVEYEKNFDMVIVNDGNLHFLHYFLTRIATQSLSENTNIAYASNEPDCFNFQSGVTTLVTDTSTTEIFTQTIVIIAGGTCRLTHDGSTMINFSDTIIAKYARYAGDSCSFTNYINCPEDQWYSGSGYTRTCYVETIVNNGPSAQGTFTISLKNARFLALYVAGFVVTFATFMF